MSSNSSLLNSFLNKMILNTMSPIENTLDFSKSRFLLTSSVKYYSGDIYLFLFYTVILVANLYFLLFSMIISFGSRYFNSLLNLINIINYYIILFI